MCRHRDQAGYSLLEALIAIVLTAFVILGLAGALVAAIKSSTVAERMQVVDSATSSFTESLKAMPYPGTGDCPTLQDYRDAWAAFPDAWTAPPGVNVSITGIEHWHPDGTDKGTYTADCPGPGADPYVHRLTVEVDLDDYTRTAQTVVTQR